MRFAIIALSFILIFSGLLLTAEDPAKGHYESALFFLRSQKFQQALDDLNFIVKSFPQSSYADDALLQLGLFFLEQRNELDPALNYFQQIKDSYTNSNSAPAAYYYIGEIYLAKRDQEGLDEAYANFERVTRIFPSSLWVDKSLVGAGRALMFRGEYDKAYEEFAKVKVRFADSPLAPVAQFQMGICSVYNGRFIQATTDFQQVIDRFPNSEYARSALEVNTIIYRLHIAPLSNKKTFPLDTNYSAVIRELDEPAGLAIDSKRNLYLSDKDKKAVYQFDPFGKLINTTTITSPYSIFIDDQDHVIIANGNTVAFPEKEAISFSFTKESDKNQTNPEPLNEIRSAAVDTFGNYYIVSNKMPGILIFDKNASKAPGGSFSRTEKEFAKVILNSRNQIYALDRERKQIILFAQDGKILFGIGPAGKGFEFDKIEDFAIDRINHIYVLTKNPRHVFIFSPSGNLLRFIPSEKTGSIAFEDAKLITVGPSGEIYLLDKDLHKVLKIG